MLKGKEVKEDERAFIVGMEKGGATISKIVEETCMRPRRTVATILRKYRLRGNVFQTAKHSCRPSKTTSRDHNLWYGVPCLMMELFHSPLLMAMSLVQSTVASCKNNHCQKSHEWPAQSPDLNTIENLWMFLKKEIRKRCTPPKTLSDLQAVIREEWEKIPLEIVQTLIESMQRRVKQVIKLKDLHKVLKRTSIYFWYNLCERAVKTTCQRNIKPGNCLVTSNCKTLD